MPSPAVPQSPVNSPAAAREYLEWIASAAPRLSIAGLFCIVDAINLLGVEVVIGSFEIHPHRNRYSVELGRWKDRRSEGVAGDPHTHRSRITFRLLTGSDLPALMCQAAEATLLEVPAPDPTPAPQADGAAPCPICGSEERDHRGLLKCECPCPSTLESRRKIASEIRGEHA